MFAIAKFGSTFNHWCSHALGAVLVLSAQAAWADPPGRVGRISATQGRVLMLDDQQGQWVEASRNRPLTQGDRLSLAPGARATVHIGSATLRLDGDTELEVPQLDDRQVRLHLHAGSVALQLPVAEVAREFQVLTPEGAVWALDRAHFRVDRRASGAGTVVSAWDGALRVQSPDTTIDIPDGQKAEIWQERGRTTYAWAPMDRDGFTDWVVASERRDSAAMASYQHVSPEMTGAHDLGRYGVWDTHEQYGAIWYPSQVQAGWAPYRDGQWMWVQPWGWTWVDNAPWGFAPFHYGRWVQYRGRWAWVPGRYTARPVYAPALVAWFGGPNLSVNVTVHGHDRSHPHVGWVPLAPFEVFSPWYVASALYLGTINVTPWRDVRGYHQHVHRDYVNRQQAWTVVPQRVLLERQPIRQDVITPQQGRVWRGDAVVHAGAVPTVPPSPSRVVRQGSVEQAPHATRVVPWGQTSIPPMAAPQAPGVSPGPIVASPGSPGVAPQSPTAAPSRAPMPAPMPAPVIRDRDERPVTRMPSDQAPPVRAMPPAFEGAAAPARPQPQPAPVERVIQPERPILVPNRPAVVVAPPSPPPAAVPMPRTAPPQVQAPAAPSPARQRRDEDDERGPRRGQQVR